jgi:hypothetical protein
VLDTFTNQSDGDVTVNVGMTAPSRQGAVVDVAPSSVGNNYLIYESPLVSVVYGDSVGTLKPKVSILGNSELLNWRVTVPARGSVSLMHFHILSAPDLASAQDMSERIVNKTMQNMTEGLSSNDKQSIKNFSIQP